jgi:hypothetical protein
LSLLHTADKCVIVCASGSNSAPDVLKNLPTYGEIKMKFLETLVVYLIAATLFVGMLGCMLSYFDVLTK